MNSVVWLVTSLQIQNSNNADVLLDSELNLLNSNNADVLLDSGLNLFNTMANLCSKLYYEVLLMSGNYIVYLLKWTSDLDFNMGSCVIQI